MKKRFGVSLVLFVFVTLLVVACSNIATSPAMCAYIYGDGSGGDDAKLHRILLPQEQAIYDPSEEKIVYVPCNSRNYIVNDGTRMGLDGKPVGDMPKLLVAYTKRGVGIAIGARALWTLNQNKDALELFYADCHKYTCWSDKDMGGAANFSTPGWNGLLAETFSYAMETAAREAAYQVDESIWETQNPDEYENLAGKMAPAFMKAVQANLGHDKDLFCGSGNSVWEDPKNPGKGKFDCKPVRIAVDLVMVLPQSDQTSGGAQAVNAQLRMNAEALYGPKGGDYLAQMDMIKLCAAEKQNCTVIIGSDGVPVAIPGNVTKPVLPVPTPVKK